MWKGHNFFSTKNSAQLLDAIKAPGQILVQISTLKKKGVTANLQNCCVYFGFWLNWIANSFGY
jgi:hypothetical protein